MQFPEQIEWLQHPWSGRRETEEASRHAMSGPGCEARPPNGGAGLDAYALSDLSGPQFARSAGIQHQTLVPCRKQAKAVPISPPSSTSLFFNRLLGAWQ